MSPPALSPRQAETFGLLLATKLAEILQLQEPRFYTDNSVLASASAASDIIATSSHWMIRPLIAAIQSSNSFQSDRINHLPRSFNVKDHHQACLATKIQNTSLAFRCLCSNTGQCPVRDIFSVASMNPFMLLSVKCAWVIKYPFCSKKKKEGNIHIAEHIHRGVASRHWKLS